MEYRGNDPGAVQFGNFINYYQFNSAEERISLLPDNVWLGHDTHDQNPYLVLDIGCNSGNVTRLLHAFLARHTKRKVHILGIDIDPNLIERAKNSESDIDDVTYKCVDVMAEDTSPLLQFLSQHGKTFFDATFCLSVTMWIHLNNGDEGLKYFLEKCTSLTKLLVMEPQPWRCYQTAVKRLRKAKGVFVRFSDLKWRSSVEEDIQNYLVKGLTCELIHKAEPNKWKRKICIYLTANKT